MDSATTDKVRALITALTAIMSNGSVHVNAETEDELQQRAHGFWQWLVQIAPDKVAPDQAAHAAQASTDADGQEAQTPPNNLETLQALVQREEGADMVRGTVFGTKMVGMMDRFEALQVQFALMKKELDDLGDLLDDMSI
ncbi:hypothetical protein C8Q76DRAFT_692485 [Earliella scabrosa]|nr:hypothetical protein C8Q76DRAFT_692485 [Earliella scabrosa]